MAEVFFDNPPVLQGDEKNQLITLYRYLNAMSEKLNTALNSISVGQMDANTQQVIRTGNKAETEQQVAGLKSLIIKTAEIVHGEMDEISTTLESRFNYISDQFGTMQENITSRIEANARGITQNYEYIQTIQQQGNNNATLTEHFRQYIFAGILDTTTQKAGIAIGEHVTNDDGTYNSAAKMATFTMDRLSFWQGDVELAYFSDNVFHIPNGEVGKTMKMGRHTWKVLADDSLALISG